MMGMVALFEYVNNKILLSLMFIIIVSNFNFHNKINH